MLTAAKVTNELSELSIDQFAELRDQRTLSLLKRSQTPARAFW
jgi:hypothetical protein